jgi:hypothetical protein
MPSIGEIWVALMSGMGDGEGGRGVRVGRIGLGGNGVEVNTIGVWLGGIGVDEGSTVNASAFLLGSGVDGLLSGQKEATATARMTNPTTQGSHFGNFLINCVCVSGIEAGPGVGDTAGAVL